MIESTTKILATKNLMILKKEKGGANKGVVYLREGSIEALLN